MFNSSFRFFSHGLLIIALAFAFGSFAPAIASATPEFQFLGYMRAGTGFNLLGGKQECFSNAGAPGNEFRLGNECGIYGEATLRTHLLKASKAEDPFFDTTMTFAFFPPGNSQYEDSDTDGRDINVVEAYTEGGNFDGVPLTFWAGKRFYRQADIHMDDFYYFAAMSGNGAGVGNINLGIGKLKLAVLQETATQTSGGSTSTIKTSSGSIGKTALDAQIYDIKLTEIDILHLWLAAATASPGVETSTGKAYESGDGYVVGARWHRKLAEGIGFNNVAVVYGSGVMESMDMSSNVALQQGVSTAKNANRLRLVEYLTTPLSPNWEMHFAAIAEERNNGAASDAKSSWYSIGVRPVYFITDHFHFATEAGYSVVKNEADRVAGARIGERQLMRLTLAPEVSLSRAIFGRPVIRFFVTQSMWNDDNKTFIANSAPSFANKTPGTSGTSLGFQTEAWF